jgi:hypothetical protein
MRKILFVTVLLATLNSFGQSKRLWLKYGDDAFLKKDYTTAIMYYKQVLDDTTVLKELVLPYEVQIVNLKTKDFKEDTAKKTTAKPKKEINYIMLTIN